MEETTLYTRDGHKVVTITIPIFTPPAEVIQWGARIFVLRDGRYVEGMRWMDPADESARGVLQDVAILDLLYQVRQELHAAIDKHPPLNSFHEAYAVILEELDEYWQQVKAWPERHDDAEMRKELLHIAAMCLRTIMDRKL